MTLPARFSRAAFLESAATEPLAEALADAVRARLLGAADPASEERRCVDELIALGHPLRLFRSESWDSGHACEYFDDWEQGPGAIAGDLFLGTSFHRPDRVEIEVTFSKERR